MSPCGLQKKFGVRVRVAPCHRPGPARLGDCCGNRRLTECSARRHVAARHHRMPLPATLRHVLERGGILHPGDFCAAAARHGDTLLDSRRRLLRQRPLVAALPCPRLRGLPVPRLGGSTVTGPLAANRDRSGRRTGPGIIIESDPGPSRPTRTLAFRLVRVGDSPQHEPPALPGSDSEAAVEIRRRLAECSAFPASSSVAVPAEVAGDSRCTGCPI